jgi:hypothetical protein
MAPTKTFELSGNAVSVIGANAPVAGSLESTKTVAGVLKFAEYAPA